jgi:hypothetical protein
MPNTEGQTSPKVYPIRIDAGNDLTEVVVVDGAFRKVGAGLRRLELQVPAGLYLVKTRVGDATRERFISVPEQLSLIDGAEDTPTTSVTPLLNGPMWTPEERAAERALLSRIPRPGDGEGVLTIVVRDPRPSGRTTDDLTINDLSGAPIASIDDPEISSDERILSRGPVVSLALRLPPGGFILQSRIDPRKVFAMALWVTAGRETRVYLEPRLVTWGDDEGRPLRTRAADLASCSILIVPPGTDICAGEAAEATRLIEMARSTLATERPIFPPAVLEQHLHQKFLYPMLGILGAHLLALQPEPDRGLLQEVIQALDQLVLPGSPDVAALQRYFGNTMPPAAPGPSVECPPMLRASWIVLAGKAAADPSVIVANSPADWIGSRITSTRPWLIWDGAWNRQLIAPTPVDNQRVAAVIDALTARAREGRPPGPASSPLACSVVDALRDADSFEGDALSEISRRLKLPNSTLARELLGLNIDDLTA